MTFQAIFVFIHFSLYLTLFLFVRICVLRIAYIAF